MSRGAIPVSFQNDRGETLAGRLHLPAGRPRAHALFAHCFTCSKDLNAVVRIARALAAEGIATLRFDFTGLGESDGEFAETTVTGNVRDLVAAADYLRAQHGPPRILIGHSLGGAATLLAAPQVDDAVAVATIGTPCTPAHVRHLLTEDLAVLERDGEAEVEIGGRPFRLKKSFLDDLEAHHGDGHPVGRLGKALLLLHSPQDRIVGVDNARTIYDAARHPKSFISLDGADHLLTHRPDSDYVGRVLASWASRYLPEPVDPGDTTDRPEVPRGVVEVVGGAQGTMVAVQAGPHRFGADEPESVPGGTDTGPDPYGLLLGSLGACTVMTVRLYADRKGWPLEGARVRLRHERIHADDSGELAQDRKGPLIDQIQVELWLDGPLDPAQRQRLVEIAHRCPVHKTMTTETRIHIEAPEAPAQDG